MTDYPIEKETPASDQILSSILGNSHKPPIQEIPNILNPKIPFASNIQSYVVVLQDDAKSRGDITQGKFMVLVRLNGESFNICTTENFKTATVFNQDKKFIKELIKLAFPNKSFTFMNIEKND